jgi:hypothetical protein
MSREIIFYFMKKFLFLLLFGFSFISLKAQRLNVGFSTVASLVKLESNFEINERFDAGVFYGLGVKGLGFPHYYGGSFKYQFEKVKNNKGTLGAYVGSSIGMSYAPAYTVQVLDLSSGSFYYDQYDAVKKFCGSAFIGTEQYIGKKKRFSSFEEIHLGYMPNYLGYALKGLFGALQGKGDTNPSRHTWWAFQAGIRIHMGK